MPDNAQPLFAAQPIEAGVDAFAQDFERYFSQTLGRRHLNSQSPQVFQALALTVRDRMMEGWNQTRDATEKQSGRVTAYLSLEFLMGRLLRNTLLNLGLEDTCRQALARYGLDLNEIAESEHDAGLGNGGLGRLAACFMDSCATLGLPVIAYGLRYEYGMFRQEIDNGYQIEQPDPWLREGYPWEIVRYEIAQRVHFGGRSEAYTDDQGKQRWRWTNTEDVLAVPFDLPVPGYARNNVNTLRLWSAMATDAFNLEEFHAGSYSDAVAEKNAAENITMVLYPNAASENGKELRLRQQYLLASASLKDSLRRWCERHEGFEGFAEAHCFQLNDTHPSIAVAELMRLLLDEHRLDWDQAWSITQSTMAYTNHTLLPEALEMWSVDVMERLLPRVTQIIFEINSRFLVQVAARWPGDTQRLRAMSLIYEGSERMIRMAYLAIVGSFSVNGVAELHSRLLTQGLFKDFYQLWPEKFNNKTNGVTPRRWLSACNPDLAELISDTIGHGWETNLRALRDLGQHADENNLQQRWASVKTANKKMLATLINERCGIAVDPAMLFDVQVKRIHEYKRQLLNILHAIHLYARIKRGDIDSVVPRCIIIGGKAAPGYERAKLIIKLINNVAHVINNDPQTENLLRVAFLHDYNVSAMEIIATAADISSQISTAGKEASGTGNMKFMLNGALTVGTYDGANIEILDAVGEENFYLFGLRVEEIADLKGYYDPSAIIAEDADLKAVMQLLETGHFNQFEPGIFDDIIAALRDPEDMWFTVADFRAFAAAQQLAASDFIDGPCWQKKSILNTAASGHFSTDRTIEDYNRDIWRLNPVQV